MNRNDLELFNTEMLKSLREGKSVLRSLKELFYKEDISIELRNLLKAMINDIELGSMLHEAMKSHGNFNQEYLECVNNFEIDGGVDYSDLFEKLTKLEMKEE